MLLWYAANAVLAAIDLGLRGTGEGDRGNALRDIIAALDSRSKDRVTAWENLGGQLVPIPKLEALLDKARGGGLHDWNDMHAEYARLSAEYPADKAAHAWAVLRLLSQNAVAAENSAEPRDLLAKALVDLAALSVRVEAEVLATRAKDYANPFRKATFRSDAEMLAVVGRAEDNPFVAKTKKDMAALRSSIKRLSSI
jgi:hypothetical protein